MNSPMFRISFDKFDKCVDFIVFFYREWWLNQQRWGFAQRKCQQEKLWRMWLKDGDMTSSLWSLIGWLPGLVICYITNWKDPPCFMGKVTISMVIFHSYVKLPEGRWKRMNMGSQLLKPQCIFSSDFSKRVDGWCEPICAIDIHWWPWGII